MPLVEVTYAASVADQLPALAVLLPHEVSLAVECPEEPYDHDLQPGDVDLRFRPYGPHDTGGLDLVVEVRSKFVESRAADRDARCARLCDAIVAATGVAQVGVFLTLPVAGWSDTVHR